MSRKPEHRMAAYWDGPPAVAEIAAETYADETPADEYEMASIQDIVEWRSVRPRDVETHHATAYDYDLPPIAKFETISEYDLRASSSVVRGGGSGDKGAKKEPARLTGLQRIDRHVAATRYRDGGAYLPETDSQTAERQLAHAAKIAKRDAIRVGRPRKGTEIRVHISLRVDPQTAAAMVAAGEKPGDILDAWRIMYLAGQKG